MANQILFAGTTGPLIPPATTQNAEGAPAYAMSPRHALAQYAATGCFGQTFYATAESQLARVMELCDTADPEFVAKVAIYSRSHAYLKDMPALLCAWLSAWAPRLHERVFPRVIDDLKMLRTYAQIMRSGVVGRKSFGTAPKRLIREWLAARDENALFRASAGQSPSLADLVKMVHPKPTTPTRAAFYAYLTGRPFDAEALPSLVRQFQAFQQGRSDEFPDLPFTLLSALPLTKAHWVAIAANASWQTTRMNLNTFTRHRVFEAAGMIDRVAKRLRDPNEIRRARVFPYQLLVAYYNCGPRVPAAVRDALQDAMELATANALQLRGEVVVCPDVSGSMSCPVTGWMGHSSAVRCVDVAALVAACVLRNDRSARVLPFEHNVVPVELNGRDSIMTNAAKLAAIGGGGTNCSAPLRLLNERQAKADLVLFVSDNESWMDGATERGTAMMQEWEKFRRRNRRAKLVCLDIQPNETSQTVNRPDILNIGGFSDHVFDTIAAFASGELTNSTWIAQIESIVV